MTKLKGKAYSSMDDIHEEFSTAVSQLNNIHKGTEKLVSEKTSLNNSSAFLLQSDLERINANESCKRIIADFDAAMELINLDEFSQLCLRIESLQKKTDDLLETISFAETKILALESVLREVANIESQ